MLYLTLKYGEPLQIGEDVVVIVTRDTYRHSDVVRLHVQAPHDIPVDRSEVHERKLEERRWGA